MLDAHSFTVLYETYLLIVLNTSTRLLYPIIVSATAGIDVDEPVVHGGASETAMILATNPNLVADDLPEGHTGTVSAAAIYTEGIEAYDEAVSWVMLAPQPPRPVKRYSNTLLPPTPPIFVMNFVNSPPTVRETSVVSLTSVYNGSRLSCVDRLSR